MYSVIGFPDSTLRLWIVLNDGHRDERKLSHPFVVGVAVVDD